MRMLTERRRPVGEGRGIRDSHGEDIEGIEGDGTVPVAVRVVQTTLLSALTLNVLSSVHVADGDGANSIAEASLVLFTRGENPGCIDCRECKDLSLP